MFESIRVPVRITPAARPASPSIGALLGTAASAVAAAGLIHLGVAPEHLQEYPPFGVFFLIVGAGQIALAAAMLAAPSRRLLVAGLDIQVSLLALWLVSRTIGLPIGPHPWQPESIGLADIACVTCELLASLLLTTLLLRRPRKTSPRRLTTVALGLPGLVVALALAFVGTGSGLSAATPAVSAAPQVPGQNGVSVTDLREQPGTQPVDRFTLTAEPAQIAGHEAWAYNGSVPGPTLRVRQGDRVVVTLVNHLPVSTTIHWHGLRLPNADDGVAGVTQNAVQPGASYTYDFVVKDAGTFWYHSHQDTGDQIPAGLFGALVVEPSEANVPQALDETVVMHDMPGGSTLAMNGAPGESRISAAPGETVRLRIINAVPPSMDGGPEAPVLIGAPYRIVSLDGHDLAGPGLLGPERIPLGIGERADLVFTMPAQGSVELVTTEIQGATSAVEQFLGGGSAAATLVIGSSDPPATPDLTRVPVFDETTYGSPEADPVAAGLFNQTDSIVLGEHPGFRDGGLQLIHTINGAASPNVPPIVVHDGDLVRLHVVNQTGEYHPMHLHGHVMSVIAVDGKPLRGSPLHLDTVLVGPGQTIDVAFRADNPGIWMFHCHVLLHAGMGMSMTINYAGVYSPYEMGGDSGNMPE